MDGLDWNDAYRWRLFAPPDIMATTGLREVAPVATSAAGREAPFDDR
jgi:hypothetical protein